MSTTTTVRSAVKTGRASGNVIVQDYQNPVYASTLSIKTNGFAGETLVQVALTGNTTVSLNVSDGTIHPFIGDKAAFYFSADSTNRVVSFGTGFADVQVLTILASGYGIAAFEYNGTSWIPSYVTSGATAGTDVQTPAYTATLSVTTTQRTTKLIPAQLTGAMTINMVSTSAIAGDVLEVAFGADGTQRVVTFGTGLKTSGTMTIPATKFGGIRFMYDGTEWIATGREITA